jgi:hypothetical protein
MSNAEFSELVIAAQTAEQAHKADPANAEKLDQYFRAYRAYRHGLEKRQDRMYAEAYPVVQFERQPDEGLL